MNYMFTKASNFNQPLDKWNLNDSIVHNGMFAESVFFKTRYLKLEYLKQRKIIFIRKLILKNYKIKK